MISNDGGQSFICLCDSCGRDVGENGVTISDDDDTQTLCAACDAERLAWGRDCAAQESLDRTLRAAADELDERIAAADEERDRRLER